MVFYIGMHHPYHSWAFDRVIVSIRAVKKRKPPFYVNKMDHE